MNRIFSGVWGRTRGVWLGVAAHATLICAAASLSAVQAQSVTATGSVNPRVPDPPLPHWYLGTYSLSVGYIVDGTLRVEGGGTVSSDGGDIGASGGTGEATVTGSGSRWDNTAWLSVNRGTLRVEDGGTVTSSSGTIGDLTYGYTGAVTVTGSGSRWNNTGWLSIDRGTLTVAGGGTVTSNSGAIGGSMGGYTGAVTVTGSGSRWDNTGGLSVYRGTLRVADGGTVTSQGGAIGDPMGGGTSEVVVTGPDSLWDNTTGRLSVNQGTLTVADGGTVTSQGGDIGELMGMDAVTVTVTGSDSLWDNTTGRLSVNLGTLTVADGGTVTSQGGAIGDSTGGGISAVVVTGSDSLWDNTTGRLFVNHGTLTVEDGGTVTSNGGTIGDPMGMDAVTVTVTGSDSLWDNTGSLSVNQGALTVDDGGILETAWIQKNGSEMGSGSRTLSIDGGVLRANADEGSFLRNWAVGDVRIGAQGIIQDTNGFDIGIKSDLQSSEGGLTKVGAGTLTLTGAHNYGGDVMVKGGTLAIVDGGTVFNTQGFIGFTDGAESAVTIGGVESIWKNNGSITVGGSGGIGELTIAGGATVSTGDVGSGVNVADGVTSAGTVNIGAGATDGAGAPGILDSSLLKLGSGAGTLVFNHTGTDYEFSTALASAGSGSHLVNHLAGVTQLTGDGSGFTGTTIVSGGTLIVDNTLGGSASVTGGALIVDGTFDGDVKARTTGVVSGAGTITGDGDFTGDGVLAGAQGKTLRIDGDVKMDAASVVNVELGGAPSDALFDVGGDLALNGTLNVSDQGGFGLGVYRLFDYDGALSGDGLAIGDIPTGVNADHLQLQASVANQINLVLAAGSELGFWDGDDTALHNNKAVDGGAGTWRADGRNWTDADGTFNGPFLPAPTYAVFQATGGLVSVDTSVGKIGVTGMQFAADGYRIEGDAITLEGPGDESILRVGDGTSAGISATVAAELTGVSALIKTDLGTLVLEGSNSYLGGTRIDAGVLSVSSDANLGHADGALTFNGGTLATTGSFDTDRAIALTAAGRFDVSTATVLELNGAVDGAGELIKQGEGTLVLEGANNYLGGTRIDAGVLSVSSDANLGHADGALTFNGGMLATTGSFDTDRAIALTAAGRFDVSTATVLELNGAVDDAGELIKQGGGTLVLEGANNYLGGTRIDAGVLSVSSDANLGHADGVLTFNGGTLATTASFDTDRAIALTATGYFDVATATKLELNGAVSGVGDLIKQGEGTLVLSGANTYGDTWVMAGTLVGTAGSISGNIANAAAVTFDQTTDARFAGNISGAGGINGTMLKKGVGILALDGASTLDWTIAEGALETAAARFGGDVLLDGAATALTFTDAGDAAYGGVISGTGRFSLDGGGTVLLTGDSSGFAGTVSISSGKLTSAAGGVLGGTLEVRSGATLGGSGTVGSGVGSLVTVASGGTLAPGNSIGTLTVDGDLVFETGSRLDIEVDPHGMGSDRVAVTGDVSLNGGSVVHIGAAGEYELRSTYTILSADGTLTGQFDKVTSNFAFLTPDLLYDYGAGTVGLALARNGSAFALATLTGNQAATANGIESIGLDAGHAVYDAIALLPDDPALIGASLDALSGEIHGSVKTVLIEDSRFIRNAANDRMRAAFATAGASRAPAPAAYGQGHQASAHASAGQAGQASRHGPVVWSQAFGSWGKTDGDGNAASLDRDTGGLLIGADRLAGDWRLGLMAGYSHTTFTASDRASSGQSDNYHLGVYGATQWGKLALRTGAAYTWYDIHTERTVSMPGLDDHLSADNNAGAVQAFGELGYGIDLSDTRVEPFANLAYVRLRMGGYSENGGAAALSGASQSTETSFTTLGLRGEHTMMLGTVSAALRGMLGWRHAFGETTPESAHAFSAGDAFTIAGAPIAQDSAVLEAGLDLRLAPDATFGLSYTGQFSGSVRDHGAKASLSIRF